MTDQVEIHRLMQSKDMRQRKRAVEELINNFAVLKDKVQAWDDLHRLTQDIDEFVRMGAANALGVCYSHIPEESKKQAWEDLHALTQDRNNYVRNSAANALGSSYSHISEDYKEKAWDDLISLRVDVAYAIIPAFPHIIDKEKGWKDLIKLTQDNDINVRTYIASALGSVIKYIPDKDQVWRDLIKISLDMHSDVQWQVASALCFAFPYVSDKKQAWNDLNKFIQDEDSKIRRRAAFILSAVFPYVPDKKQAWNDLLMFTKDEEELIQWQAANGLLSNYPHATDKNQAWQDLHKLIQSNGSMIELAASALGSIFPYIPDKEAAWNDLLKLTKYYGIVSVSAFHSLGKISIFKATEAANDADFRKELENAIEFFEKSSHESSEYTAYGDNFSDSLKPASFCLPFYRSFYTIAFEKQEAKAKTEVQIYLSQAKKATAGSESKQTLLEAINNLAKALSETQNIGKVGFDEMKLDLNSYRRYCDRACRLLETAEKKAPGASKLIRKGLPIIDDMIKEILVEIEGKAKALCKQTKGTQFEDLGKEVNRYGQALLQLRDPIGLEKRMNSMQITLSNICVKMPEEERGEVYDLLRQAKEELDIEDKIYLINIILGKISSQISIVKIIENIDKKLDKKFDEMIVSLKPGISEKLTITVGAEFYGTGIQHVITIPLQEISYPELRDDLKKINEKSLIKFAGLPLRLATKIKDYIIRNKIHESLE